MKKLVLAAVVALLASLGTVTVSSGAQAADPYPGFVPTNCRIKVDHNGGKKNAPRILTLVEVPNSKAHPKGLIRIVVKRQGGKVIFRQSLTSGTGRTLKFFAPKAFKSRRYTAKITFTPVAGTVFTGCSRKGRFTPSK